VTSSVDHLEWAAGWPCLRRRLVPNTLYPEVERGSAAVASPMPEDAPVTMAILWFFVVDMPRSLIAL
jgi:hypothetical protein